MQSSNQFPANDLLAETLLTFSAAAKYVSKKFPERRGGRPVNISTVHRWATRGVGGVRLEHIRVGGTRFTSQQALGRFFCRLGGGGESATTLLPPAGPRSRAKRIAAADRELERAGI